MTELEVLLEEVRACRVCEADLELGPRPILSVDSESQILIMGQAPGVRVHRSGIPWDDPSGARLRDWMGISDEDFYDETKVALLPLGFCYPGAGKTGDLPPRKECSELWHDKLMQQLTEIKLTLIIGSYAQAYRLGSSNKASLTDTVASWRDFAPESIPLPHPSPRNNRWLKKNPWFEEEVLPYLKKRVAHTLLN